MAAKLKKGDRVIVLTGRDKGREGDIIEIRPAEGRAVVSGINMVVRHQRQTQNSEGGRFQKPAPIAISNLAYVDPKEGGATRVGFKMEGDKKVRYAKKSGEIING